MPEIARFYGIGDHLRQIVKPAQATSFFLRTHARFEINMKHAIS